MIDPELLDEVTALVEWPEAVAGDFEARFLELPREVLISTLQEHQRYFPVETRDGKLMAHFVTVSNIRSRDSAKVQAGNERVVRPRLSDAAFFFAQDRKQPLAARVPALDAVTFQAKLGSIGDKVRRVVKLAGEIALVIDADRAKAERAAMLAKCDLLSNMVGEFPELQGIMGRYYATADGEPADVASAIDEHYMPRGAGGELPGTGAGIAVALADKLDTLAGIFSIGQKPTGTKDPFGLRRAAIGVLRILIEKKLDLDLRALVDARGAGCSRERRRDGRAGALGLLHRAAARRISSKRRGVGAVPGATTEMFDAVARARRYRPLDFSARLSALVRFLALPEAASLIAANKRIANILKKADGGAAGTMDARCCASRPRRRCTKRWWPVRGRRRARARQARLRRRAHAARDAASHRRRILRRRDGQRGGRRPAPQPPRVAREPAWTVHAHRGPVLPAWLSPGRLPMQWFGSIVFTVFMWAWMLVFGISYCVITPFLPFRGRFWMAGVMTARGVLRAARVLRPEVLG